MKLFLKIGTSLLVLFFVFGCFYFIQSFDYEKIADRITAETAKELKEEKHLYLIGTGGQMMDDIQMMAMSFNYYQEVSVETGRELIIHVISAYLAAINNNTEIRPYLHEYPFNAKNIEIRIFVYNTDRSEVSLEKIDCVTSINGVIKYYIRSNSRQAIYKETYDQALKENI